MPKAFETQDARELIQRINAQWRARYASQVSSRTRRWTATQIQQGLIVIDLARDHPDDEAHLEAWCRAQG